MFCPLDRLPAGVNTAPNIFEPIFNCHEVYWVADAGSIRRIVEPELPWSDECPKIEEEL